MGKKKEFKEYRDNYTLRFNDDEAGVTWTTGNLSRFLRNLWNANPVLRENNPDRTAREFALRVGHMMVSSLTYQTTKKECSTANFYLVPRACKYRNLYAGTITKNVMKATKVIG